MSEYIHTINLPGGGSYELADSAARGALKKSEIVEKVLTSDSYGSSDDLNNLMAGVVYTSSSTANIPSSGNWIVFAFRTSSSTDNASAVQIAVKNANAPEMCIRVKFGTNGWTAWKNITLS